MANSPVLELQALASSGSSDIQDVLLKAKMISVKLGLNSLTEWIKNEINGYPYQNSTPEYRVISNAPVRALNPYRGWVHVDLSNLKDDEVYKIFTTIYFVDPISTLQEYAKNDDSLYVSIPQPIAEYMHKMTGESGFQLAWIVSPKVITGIISRLKSEILDWTLDLESKGIMGEGLLFSQEEKEVAPMTIQNITNIHGNVNNAGVIGSGNENISQQNTINAGDFNSLERELKKIGVSNEDIQELKQAIDESPQPTTKDNLGGKIGNWIGKMVGKAYSGSLKVAASVAPVVLTNAICAYFNIAS